MATDHSQNMDVFGKQELGWLVPRVLKPGQTTTVTGWQDTKLNTHRIDWKTPERHPVHADGAGVNNGPGYVASCRGARSSTRRVVAVAAATMSGGRSRATTSAARRVGGHNLDIALPELATCPPAPRSRVASSRAGTSNGTSTTAS